MKKDKRVTVFAGHYGSGKTNIAINYALGIKKSDNHVAIADLDIVNPYFRTKDSEDMLSKNNIRLISSPYANTNVDVPALPAEAYSILDNPDLYSIVDVGGDDRGALALGRYRESILLEDNFNMYFVINKYRPLTQGTDDTIEVMKEIEKAAGMKFTGIINNSNLGEETTIDDILSSVPYAEKISKETGLEIAYTTVLEKFKEELEGKIENLMPIKIYVKQSFTF